MIFGWTNYDKLYREVEPHVAEAIKRMSPTQFAELVRTVNGAWWCLFARSQKGPLIGLGIGIVILFIAGAGNQQWGLAGVTLTFWLSISLFISLKSFYPALRYYRRSMREAFKKGIQNPLNN